MAPMPGHDKQVTLQATYTSPTGAETFSHPIASPIPPAPPSTTFTDPAYTKSKTAYLAELRASTKKLQEDINVFLTEKMEEDRARTAAGQASVNGTSAEGGKVQGQGKVQAKTKEEVEEERYGEEGGDEEDEA
jgi:hypothetical protein